MLRTETLTCAEAGLLNPLQLAYIGDAVWETLIRCEMIRRRINLHHMHIESVKYVNAHAQAEWMREMEPLLDERETEIARRGRNADARHPAPRNQSPGDYAAASAFEAVIGYWYLTGSEEKLKSVFDMIIGGLENGRGEKT